MTSPLDRAAMAGIRPTTAQPQSTVQPVLSVPVSTTKEIQTMSTENTPATETAAPATVAVDAATLSAMLATMQQQSAQIAALTAQVQQQQNAPASVASTPEEPKKPFRWPQPSSPPFIPEEASVYPPCQKDKATGRLTTNLNGTICVAFGPHSKLTFIPEVWLGENGILRYFESGQAREDITIVHKTGKKPEKPWQF